MVVVVEAGALVAASKARDCEPSSEEWLWR